MSRAIASALLTLSLGIGLTTFGDTAQAATTKQVERTKQAKIAKPTKAVKQASAPAKRGTAAADKTQRVTRLAKASRDRDSDARSARIARAERAVKAAADLDNADPSTPPRLASSAAYVIDSDTHEVLMAKNDTAVMPIASITKLMTALVVMKSNAPMDEMITITDDEIDREKGTGSRLPIGATLTRKELLHLALMSSENRAAHALGRSYPGGVDNFVNEMNFQAKSLGMTSTHFVDPTGLNSSNRSSPRDLATLIGAAHAYPMIRDFSTNTDHTVNVGSRTLAYRTSNQLTRKPVWDIAIQKTGYISEAGRCMVMQAKMAGRKLTMVLLNAPTIPMRYADAERLRSWIAKHPRGVAVSSADTSVR